MNPNPWIEAIQILVRRGRSPQEALEEIVPKIYAEGYGHGKARGRAEGMAEGQTNLAATLEALVAGVRSPLIPCPTCKGSGCHACADTGKFSKDRPDPNAP